MYISLRKRQDELGIARTIFTKDSEHEQQQKKAPQRFRVVYQQHSSNNNINNNNDEGLAIYPFVPESEVEANDESNVLDWLDHGEIVTAVRQKKVVDANLPPPRMAVVAATAIYNVQNTIQTRILWIEHDKGGWSPSIVNGVTRLVPVDE